jgi:FkbM family methyltransferase
MSGPLVVSAPDWTMRLLPDVLAVYGVQPRGVLHVGAFHGEEVPIYFGCGFERVGLVEPDPDSRAFMDAQPWRTDPRIAVFPVACTSDASLPARFYRTEGGAWNGLKPSRQHPPLGELDVPTATVAYLQAQFPVNVLVVDAQGTEMDVLASADLGPLELIVVETHVDGADGAHPAELAAFASEHGWRAAVVWDRGSGWTDTVLVRAS